MYKILFLTDFSEHSTNAMHFTEKLAIASGSEVVIFHALVPVVGTITQMGSTVELTSVLYNTAEETLREAQEEFEKLNIPTQKILLSGYVMSELESIIEEYGINLIIMGTHGKASILDKIVGSTAAYVLTQLDVPTIVIPSKFRERTIKNVAFAHQLVSPKIDHLTEAFKFIGYFDLAHLDVAHIYSDEQDVYEADKSVLDQIKNNFSDRDLEFHFIQDDSVVNGIYDFLKEKEVDFLITSSNKKTFWKRLLSGNISATLATEFNTPILVLKD